MMLMLSDRAGERVPQDEAARVRLAANRQTAPSTLRLLAMDPAVVVRAAVAMNPAFIPAVHGHMVDDADERVRALLARKVALLLPGLSGPERDEALSHAHDMLVTLAADAAVRVRETLSEVLRTMPEAPRAAIMRLARDASVSVSEPVLRLSPLLTDADLLELLASPPHGNAAEAVARRAGLSGGVADAIASAADGTAIRALLLNGSAHVREGTLDALVGRAGDHPDWHEPLVQRPHLPECAARALSLIVAGHVLEALLHRTDLPPALTAEIRARLAAPAASDDEALLAEVRGLHGRRGLSQEALMEAAGTGDARRMAVILAVASGVPLAGLDRAVAHRNAKALVSLAWRAGFSMKAASTVQAVLGPFPPGEAIEPAFHGAFPLSINEMEWQIELLTTPAA